MKSRSRLYGFKIGEIVQTSPEFDKNPHSNMSHVEGVVSEMYNTDGISDIIYILDKDGSTHCLNETNLIPPSGWRERTAGQ